MIPSIVSLRNLINENREMSSPGGGEAFFGHKAARSSVSALETFFLLGNRSVWRKTWRWSLVLSFEKQIKRKKNWNALTQCDLLSDFCFLLVETNWLSRCNDQFSGLQ